MVDSESDDFSNKDNLSVYSDVESVAESEEVYGIVSSSNEETDLSDSDIETYKGPRIPEDKAWGRRKSTFYSTGYNDEDFDAKRQKRYKAEFEEEEAKSIYKRLIHHLDDADFNLIKRIKNNVDETNSIEDDDLIEIDKTKFKTSDTIKSYQHNFPEFFGLMNEAFNRFDDLKKIVNMNSKNSLQKNNMYYLLNYLANIWTYFLIRKTNSNSGNMHPVIERLVEFCQKVDVLKKQSQEVEDIETLNSQIDKSILNQKLIEEDFEKESFINERHNNKNLRRPITYEIAKNKGLTPHRRKDERNPRVKNRQKYRKALIKRKGAVPNIRKPLNNYVGETRGIKETTIKSVKFKQY